MTGTGSNLQRQLALLGVELQPSAPDLGQHEDSTPITREGLAYAELIRCWQDQLVSSPNSTQNVVRQLLDHLTEQQCLTGWDRWAAMLLSGALPVTEGQKRFPILSSPLDPTAISPGQLFGAAVAMARLGGVSSATLAMGWLLMPPSSACSESPAVLEDLCSAVITSALEGNRSSISNSPLSSYEGWTRQYELCVKLKMIAQSVVEPADSTTEATALALLNLANQFRTDDREIGEQTTTPFEVEIWTAESIRLLKLGDRTKAYAQLNELAYRIPVATPTNADPAAWHQLMINALTQSVPEAPRLTLVESKSLPRTGHHYLRRLLETTHHDGFTYCEYYQEPGCCKRSPCLAEAYWSHAREQGIDHLRLVKSHDFQLDDPIYEPPAGVVRLVQIRQPLDLLASWIELHHVQANRPLLENHGISPARIYLYHEKALLDTAWRIIDESGHCISTTQAMEWLTSKESYIIEFLNKWLPECQPFPLHDPAPGLRGTYVLRYEDLDDASTALSMLGRRTDSVPNSSPATKYTPRQGALLERRSKRVSSLLTEMLPQLMDAERRILHQAINFQPLIRYSSTQTA
ncbi:MAG: hypothetical protein ACK55H_03565 [Cyanobacteriota bacterium]|jgi:hypothetical protein